MPHYINAKGNKVSCEILEDRGHGSIKVKWPDGTEGRLKRESIVHESDGKAEAVKQALDYLNGT
jgi:hypothetical protein